MKSFLISIFSIECIDIEINIIMKKTFNTLTLILLILISTNFELSSQITIGSNIPPSKGALLDIKEKSSTPENLENSNKGLLLSRVALVSYDDLSPLIVSATDDEKLMATGMAVYNVTEDSDNKLIPGFYIWSGSQWNLLQDRKKKLATFTIEENQIQGAYVKNVELTPASYISITLDVTHIGEYTVTGSTTNGYSFSTSGEFTDTGVQTINAIGIGTPLQSTEDLGDIQDVITIIINDQTYTIGNTVLSKPVNYLVDCETISLNGTYIVGQSLSPSTHFLTINGVSTSDSNGGKFVLSTNTASGFSFESKGTLTSGNQTFTLSSTSGQVPDTSGLQNFTITNNSSLSGQGCHFSINVVNPGLSIYMNNTSWGGYPNNIVTLVQDPNNYGTNGAYNRIEKYTITTGSTSNTTTNITNKGTDITIVNYSMTLTSSNTTNVLNYIKSGKYLIYAADGLTTAQTSFMKDLVSGLIGADPNKILVSSTGSTNNATIVSASNVPDKYKGIINSTYFGDASNKSFQYDGGSNWGVTIDTSESQDVKDKFIPLAYTSDNYARIFVVEDQNSGGALIFLADGGAWANLTSSGYEGKSILFSNILSWIANRKYPQ